MERSSICLGASTSSSASLLTPRRRVRRFCPVFAHADRFLRYSYLASERPQSLLRPPAAGLGSGDRGLGPIPGHSVHPLLSSGTFLRRDRPDSNARRLGLLLSERSPRPDNLRDYHLQASRKDERIRHIGRSNHRARLSPFARYGRFDRCVGHLDRHLLPRRHPQHAQLVADSGEHIGRSLCHLDPLQHQQQGQCRFQDV